MFGRRLIVLFVTILLVNLTISADIPTILTNAYAKVAKWGSVTNNKNTSESIGQGRSSNGQSFFTQSSDVKLRSGQNLKDEKVVYHYSVPVQKVQIKRVDAPTKSAGFQDRFNPPPAFQFGDSKRNVPLDHDHDHSHDHSHDNPRPVYSPPKPSYDSPISSYNPQASGIPDANKFVANGPKYPPFVNGPSPTQGAAPPLTDFKGPPNPVDSGPGDYDDSNDKAPPGAPPGPTGGDDNNGGYQYNPPSSDGSAGYQYNPPTAPPMLPTPLPPPPPVQKPPQPQPVMPLPPLDHHYKFPSYVYGHPPADYDGNPNDHDHTHDQSHDHNHDHSHDHNHDHSHDHTPQNQANGDSGDDTQDMQPNQPQNHQMPNQASAPDQSDYPDSDYNHNHPQMDDHKHFLDDIPEYLDHDPKMKGKFNQFPLWSNFYDDHHDHHHYHPVTTTTTTPPPEPEDETRVNNGHYSYYYLGRKLYYIPLYFSVYFIIYITVLILKSIARHKVNFVHDLDDINKARSLGDGGDNSAKIDEMAEQTTKAIIEFKRRYIAM